MDGGYSQPDPVQPIIAVLHAASLMTGSCQLGGNLGGLGRADPLEDLPRLTQRGDRVGGTAAGQGAAAQPSQCVSFVMGAGDLAGGRYGGGVAGEVPPTSRTGRFNKISLNGGTGKCRNNRKGTVRNSRNKPPGK